MTRLLCCFAALIIIESSVSLKTASAELILNGSFENATGGVPDNWTATGNLAVSSSQGETDGTNALAFSIGNVPSNGAISQSFATIADTSYRLSFDFGKYSINQPNEVARLQVDVFDGTGFGGSQILNQLVSDATPATGEPNSTDSPSVYSPFQFDFTASGTTSTLRFSDFSDAQSGGGGFDAMLDHVRVAAVPEPSSLALVGLSVFVFLGRRRPQFTSTLPSAPVRKPLLDA